MTKYVLINSNGRKDITKSEIVSLAFKKLFDYLQINIENNFNALNKTNKFTNFGSFYKNRSKAIHKCYAINCNRSATYSHSISINAVLRNIASDNLVYTPRPKKNEIIFESVGIKNQASVFPGFCNSHDTIYFSELDKTEIKEYSIKFFEQLINRTFYREIFCKQRDINFFEIMLKDVENGFQKVKDDYINFYNSTLDNSKYRLANFQDSRFSINENIDFIKDRLIQDKYRFNYLNHYYFNITPKNITYMIINKTLPVAFSGFTNFTSNKHEVTLIINCLTYKYHTLFAIANTCQDDEIIKNELLVNYDLNDIYSILKLIEVLSVRGTDNIFFDIEYWDKLDKSLQKMFIKDFSDISSSDPRNVIDYSFLEWNYK